MTSDQVTNFEVRILIDPNSYLDIIQSGNRYPFRPGMSSNVEINTETRAGILTVPIQSVVARERADLYKKRKGKDKKEKSSKDDEDDELLEIVFLVMEGDTVKAVEVTTGIQDDSYIEITKGIKKGDKVVTGPYSVLSRKLEPGSEVKVVEEDKLYAN